MIYLIRHGKTINNQNRLVQGQTDIPLSDIGRDEAHKFGKAFKELKIEFDSFYSSPLSRAKETLEIIMSEIGSTGEIFTCNGLKERFFGEAEGIKYDDEGVLIRLCTDYYSHMEKNKELEERVYKTILKIASDNIGKNVLIVSHSHAIKAFIRNIIKDYAYSDSTHNLNVNIFDYDSNGFKIIDVNKDLI